MQVSDPGQSMIFIIQITTESPRGNQSSHGDIENERYHHRSKTCQVRLLTCGCSDITGRGEIIMVT